MLKKVLLISSILLICFISITSVCAYENLTDKTALSSSDVTDNEVLSAGEGNFTELSELINDTESSLELDKDYKYVSGDTTPSSGIVISKDMTINGNGHTIDASNLVRIFSVSGSNVILKNMTLINAKYSGSGGAIYVTGANFTLDNCKLEDNNANYGGAVYSTGANTTITNSDFKSNIANYYYGGAVVATGNDLLVENSTFTNNKYNYYSIYYGGGAIYATGSSAKIFNSEFRDNSARTYGGAVYLEGSNNHINNTTFINNTGIDSAAVYMEGSNSSLNNSKFYNNSATEYDGGAVGWYGHYGKLTNSYFENNTAVNHGGGVFWHYNYGTLDNLTFVGNNAANGAGICIMSTAYTNDDSYSYNVISNSKFINNTALYGAGGIDASAHAKIVNSTFINNTAGNYGGAVTLTNSELINATLKDNSAIYGGAIYTYNSNIENSTFEGNSAPNGNAVYILDKSTFINNKNLDESDISTYESGENRGSVYETTIDNLMTTTNDYYAFCAERYNTNPYSGVFDNRLELLRNSINHKPVGDYLKILIYEYLDVFNDLRVYDFADHVWTFTDFEYWNSDDLVIKEVIRLYDSGFRVPTENSCKVLPNGTLMYFNFSSMITGTGQQNLFLFKFDYGDLLNQSLTKETLNKTGFIGDDINFRIVMTNKGETPLYDVFVDDEDYSNGLKYIDWQSEVGNWIYNDTTHKWRLDELLPGESASIILRFNTLINGTLINNATGGVGRNITVNATNSTRIYKPGMTVEKVTITKTVELGDEAIFEIIVKNTGDMELTNVTISEYEYGDGLVYLRFKSVQGAWVESLNNASKHVFKLDSPLQAGETASFQVIFNTTKIGEFKNTVVGTYENGSEINSTNTTTVINSTSPDTPEDRTTPENNPSDEINENEKSDYKITKVDDKATGNPLLALILALLILPIRRYKN